MSRTNVVALHIRTPRCLSVTLWPLGRLLLLLTIATGVRIGSTATTRHEHVLVSSVTHGVRHGRLRRGSIPAPQGSQAAWSCPTIQRISELRAKRSTSYMNWPAICTGRWLACNFGCTRSGTPPAACMYRTGTVSSYIKYYSTTVLGSYA